MSEPCDEPFRAARLPENTENTNDKEKSFRFAFCALRARRIWEKPTLSRGRERVAVMANAKAEWVRSVEPRVRRIRDRGPRADAQAGAGVCPATPRRAGAPPGDSSAPHCVDTGARTQSPFSSLARHETPTRKHLRKTENDRTACFARRCEKTPRPSATRSARRRAREREFGRETAWSPSPKGSPRVLPRNRGEIEDAPARHRVLRRRTGTGFPPCRARRSW